MSKLVRILSLAAIAWSTIASAEAREALISYDIEAVIDLRAQLITARAHIAIPTRARAAPREVLLDIGVGGHDAGGRPRLMLLSVEGGTLSPKRREGSLAVIALAEAARLEVVWRFNLKGVDQALKGYYPLSAESPDNLWYPDVVSAAGRRERFHDFKVTLTYPENTGALTSGVSTRRGRSRTAWRESYVAPHAEAFALNFGEGYLLTEVRKPRLQVLALSSPAEQPMFRRIAEQTAATAEWYRKSYGFFPVQQLGVAPGDPRWRGGFATTNLFYVHGRDRSPAFLQFIVAHELGHYYWGLHVQSASWERLDWLVLANGIWADQLFVAESNGRTLDEQWRGNEWTERFLAAALASREQRLGLSAAEETALGFDYNSEIRHAKGAVGLWLQARRLGTARFLALQRQLLAAYGGRPLSVAEFVKRLEVAGARGAEEFFRAFVRGDASLGFEVSAVEPVRSAKGWSYKVTVLRRGTLRYPITVEIRGQSGEKVRRQLAGQAPRETFDVALATPLAEVRLDPDGVLPLWNSAHPGIRRAYVLALERAGLTEPFLTGASAHLRSQPEDDELRQRLAERLLCIGRYQAVSELLAPLIQGTAASPAACRAALLLSTARLRYGKQAEARALLGAIAEGCRRNGLAAEWQRARDLLRD